jgi:uncharacterized membrane protein
MHNKYSRLFGGLLFNNLKFQFFFLCCRLQTKPYCEQMTFLSNFILYKLYRIFAKNLVS